MSSRGGRRRWGQSPLARRDGAGREGSARTAWCACATTDKSPRDEVDRDGHALEVEAPPQLVLDPVAVVARHEPRVVHVQPEARWPRLHLRSVEEVEALSVPRGRLARLAELAERAVELRGGHAPGMALEE